LIEVAESVITGCVAIALLAYLSWVYGPIVYFLSFFGGSICAVLFLLYAPYRLLKSARDTEYMVTDQRVFFETMSEYPFEELYSKMGGFSYRVAVVDLKDIEDVYVRRGLHDRFFGTSTLYVRFKGFQRTTRHWGSDGEVILFHKPPSFAFIKDAQVVGKIIQETVERKPII